MEREYTKADMAAAARRMQDFILSHLREKISLADLARAAGYSPWHAQRIFKELTGQSPFEYVRKLRLSKAALVLRDERPRVIDVALEFMFDSHEGFTRSFAREFGVTPSRYRGNPQPVRLFHPYPIRPYPKKDERETNMNDKATQAIFVQAMERPARKILLRRGVKADEYFAYCEEVGCDVWGILCSVKEALYEPVGLWLPPRMRPAGTSAYVQGVELPMDWSGDVPEGFELADFPPETALVFQGEPYDDDDFVESVSAAMRKIDAFKPEVYGYAWAPDAGPRFQLEPQGWRGYIEGRPVRRVGRD